MLEKDRVSDHIKVRHLINSLVLLLGLYYFSSDRVYGQELWPEIPMPDQSQTCGTPEPTLEEMLKLQAAIQGRSKQEVILPIKIPVAFHIILTSDQFPWTDVPDAAIVKQIEALNQAYTGSFSFYLYAIDRTTNEAWFNRTDVGSPEELEMKTALTEGAGVLDIYTYGGAGGLIGYSYLPYQFPESDPRHGVLVAYDFLTNVSDAGALVIHEFGHALGFWHVFQGGCVGDGDLVDDTPRQKGPIFQCVPAQDTCPSDPGIDPLDNYMGYANCKNRLTNGQLNLAKAVVPVYKPNLVNQSNMTHRQNVGITITPQTTEIFPGDIFTQTIRVLANGQPLAGAPITLETSRGDLLESVTDVVGEVTWQTSAPLADSVVTVARFKQQQAVFTDVELTNIVIPELLLETAVSTATVGSDVALAITVTNQRGSVANQYVQLYSSFGEVERNHRTDVSGGVTTTLSSTTAGTVVVIAEILGKTISSEVTFLADKPTELRVYPQDEIVCNSRCSVTILVVDKFGNRIMNESVTMTTTVGSVVTTTLQTNEHGLASFELDFSDVTEDRAMLTIQAGEIEAKATIILAESLFLPIIRRW